MSESQQKSDHFKPVTKRKAKKEKREKSGSSSAQDGTKSQAGDKKSEGEEKRMDECSICITAMQPDDRCNITDCIHEFHERCICTWLRTSQQTCPLCRVSVTGLRQLSGRPVDVPLLEAQPDDDDEEAIDRWHGVFDRREADRTIEQRLAELMREEENDERYHSMDLWRRRLRSRRSTYGLFRSGITSTRRFGRVDDPSALAAWERNDGDAGTSPDENLEADLDQLEDGIDADMGFNADELALIALTREQSEEGVPDEALEWMEATEERGEDEEDRREYEMESGEDEDETDEKSEEESDEGTGDEEEIDSADFDDILPGNRIAQRATRKSTEENKRETKKKKKTKQKTGETEAKPPRDRGLSLEEIAAEARRERNMRRTASNWSEAAEGGEEEEESSEESEESSDEETEQDEESELSDTEMFDDDQPGPSHRIMQPVTRKRKSTKKKTPKTKSKTTKKKKKETIGKMKAKSPRKRELSREEGQEQRHRIRSAFPSLSLNGAAISPVGSDDDVVSPVRSARLDDSLPAHRPLHPYFSSPSDVTPPGDLIPSIFVEETSVLTPGGRLVRKEGSLRTTITFERREDLDDRMEPRVVQLPDESAARNRSDTPQAQSSARVESIRREASTRAESPSAVTSITRRSAPLPPPQHAGAPASIPQPASVLAPRSQSSFRAVASSSMRPAARPAIRDCTADELLDELLEVEELRRVIANEEPMINNDTPMTSSVSMVPDLPSEEEF